MCASPAVLYNRTIYTYKVVSQQQWSYCGCINLFSSTQSRFYLVLLWSTLPRFVSFIQAFYKFAHSLKVPKTKKTVYEIIHLKWSRCNGATKNAQCNNLNNELISESVRCTPTLSDIATKYFTKTEWSVLFSKAKTTNNRRAHKYETVHFKLISMCIFVWRRLLSLFNTCARLWL